MITYDAKSFIVARRRLWIVAGEVHYFRHPRAEWREVLLRAKRAGLNTIATYIPWNFHESTEGVADFEGDRDLAHYLDLIRELGMYAMARPGPYICSEWDGGGIPAWLCARPVRRFREDDPVYLAAVESWFDRLLPIIAEHQVTRGGPVITVQNENEYPGGWDASMRRYIRKLNAMFARHGIEVPILACNVHGATDKTVQINSTTDERDQLIEPGMILTYNNHTIVDPVYDLRDRQPDAPLIATEFWCGAPVYWGERVSDWPDHRSVARAAYEYASTGTQVVYYMFEGGTNFGFWAGNNIATSYASGYPIGDGGRLTDKYYAIRPPNLFAGQFAPYLAGSDEVPDRAGIAAPDGVRLVVRRCAEGNLAFLSAPDGRGEIPVVLPGGQRLTVHMGQVSAAVLPVGLDVFDRVTVDYSNLTLLARDEARRALILYGPAGTEGVVSVNGQRCVVPVGRCTVAHRRAGGINVIVADEQMARRCWIAGGHIVFGADFVAEVGADGSVEVKVSDATGPVMYLDAEGRPEQLPTRHTERDERPPELGPWRVAPAADIVSGRSPGWAPLDEPCAHERLGVVQGYVWYRAEVECADGGVRTLLLTHAPNRVSVFVNGHYHGTHARHRSVRMRDEYAHPTDWAFEELTVRLAKGTNTLVFLSDDLGHNYDIPAPVGLQGPVYVGSRRLEVDAVRQTPPLAVSTDAFNFLYSRDYRTPEPLPGIEFDLPVGPDEEAIVTVHGVPAWLTVNGEDVLPMSYPESPWTMFGQIKRWIAWRLPDSDGGRTRTARIAHAAHSAQTLAENLVVYLVPKSGRCVNWHWRAWEGEDDLQPARVVTNDEAADDGVVRLLPVGTRLARKGRTMTPSWFGARFAMPEGQRPVFLDIGEMQKGQVYLNGRNVGRFWRSGGTQERYYLPRSWMAADNQLVVFEELGLHPQGAALVFGDSGRWTGIRLSRE